MKKRVLEHSSVYQKDPFSDAPNILEGVAMSSLTGVLYQLGWLASMAHDLFADLQNETRTISNRLSSVAGRIQKVSDGMPALESKFHAATATSFLGNPNTEIKPEYPLDQQLLATSSRPTSVARSFEECKAAPNFDILNNFFDPPKRCVVEYSNPMFFTQAWIEAELEQRRKDQEERKAKRAQRKEHRKKLEREGGVRKKEIATLQVKQYSAESGAAGTKAVTVNPSLQRDAPAQRPAASNNRPADDDWDDAPAIPAQTAHPVPAPPAAAGAGSAAPPPPGPPPPPGAAPPPPGPPPPPGGAPPPPPGPPPSSSGAPPPPPPPGGAPPVPPPPPALSEAAIGGGAGDDLDDDFGAPAPPRGAPAPPPPPAPPAAPAPPPPPSAPKAPPPPPSGGPSIAQAAREAQPAAAPARSGLLQDIVAGRQLKKASDRKVPEKEEKASTTIGGVFDVSAILKKSLDMRRNANVGSDSEGSDSDDSDWD